MAILDSSSGPLLQTRVSETVTTLVERICASPEFEKSPRSQELLRYLCRRALESGATHITEHEIGVALFGWDRNSPPEADTIVRVQISQLRKRLGHYFLDTGKHELAEIVIPRGSYAPVIQLREQQPEMATPPVPADVAASLTQQQQSSGAIALAPLRTTEPWRAAVAGSLATLAVVAATILFYQWMNGHPAWASTPSGRPALDHFWSTFRSGASTMIVMPDANMRLLSEFLGYTIPLDAYQDGYPRGIISDIKNPRERYLAARVSDAPVTGMQDARALANLSVLLSGYNVPYTPILARDFRFPRADNLILLGHLKGNPWLSLFEDRLNYYYSFDWQTRRGMVLNRHPRAGEPGEYVGTYNHEGYCVVAYLPRAMGQGDVILIFGSDVSSLEAGGRFVCSERDMAQLYRKMGTTPERSPRHIEVLLRTRLMQNMAPEYSILTYRTYAQ